MGLYLLMALECSSAFVRCSCKEELLARSLYDFKSNILRGVALLFVLAAARSSGAASVGLGSRLLNI